VGIVDGGRLVVEGAPAALVAQLGADVIALQGAGELASFVAALQSEIFVAGVTQGRAPGEDDQGGQKLLQVGVDAGDRRLVTVLNLATAHGFAVQRVSVTRPTLGQVFLAHTGYALRD
jgi:ABC-2 type transport system ATP-binding protein